MAEVDKHLPLSREPFETERRSGGPPIYDSPKNPSQHGRRLGKQLQNAANQARQQNAGFDPRLMLKLETGQRIRGSDFEKIPGVELVSEEGKNVALVFASEKALSTFQQRLAELAAGKKPTRKELLYVLNRVDTWTKEDRLGSALDRYGYSKDTPFLLDIELWPVSRRHLGAMQGHFESQLDERDIPVVDKVSHETLILYRVRTDEDGAEWLFEHRDVRVVDLPPKFELDDELFDLPLNLVDEVPAPDDDAPLLAILDSGLMTNHPLLGPGVGDAQSFLDDEDPTDWNGHGTHVAGIALYGDVEALAEARRFVPRVRLVSGKVLDDRQATYDVRLIENQVREAVAYFVGNYGCRVFNLSLGDSHRPYEGRHLRGLAVTLDSLARSENVLFVVSTGNYNASTQEGRDYPEYLFEEAAIVDPATALNALTVGGIARAERGEEEKKYAKKGRDTIEQVMIARHGEPSPFTRTGPTIGGAIKPEVVAEAGNSVLARGRWVPTQRGLGRVTTSRQFVEGELLTEVAGTSFAAPHVAHLAARLFGEYDAMTPDLARALLVANAEPPPATVERVRLNSDKLKAPDIERVVRACGYGQIDEDTLFRSAEEDVSLLVTDRIQNKHHHFYHLPVPSEFFSSGRRRRDVVVALAYTPPVRSTRLTYKASRIFFNLIEAPDLETARAAYSAATLDENYDNIPEVKTGRTHATTLRNPGTVQCSRWTFKTPTATRRENELFVVVTRNDPSWGDTVTQEYEEYALVAKIRDRENQDARLLTQIRVELQARARSRK